jgi:hypothetical protein
MYKRNCWEIKQCGRQPGGDKVNDLGVCPACTDTVCSGINDGVNAGRICWAIAGTFCGGKVQGNFAQKSVSCMSCEVFRLVKEEEGLEDFILLRPGQVYKTANW